ncbi:hypothetical protein ACJMK2_036826, partial [Sinanodonta woodiana]
MAAIPKTILKPLGADSLMDKSDIENIHLVLTTPRSSITPPRLIQQRKNIKI